MAVIDVATEDDTIEAIDKVMGFRGRLAAQTADAVVDAARGAIDASGEPDHRQTEPVGRGVDGARASVP